MVGPMYIIVCFPKVITIFCINISVDKKRKGEEEVESPSAKSKKGRKCTDLIVLNLAWKTDEAALQDYFSRFGKLVMAQVKRHPMNQQSKGYGFIRFSDYESQVMCLAERHYIDARWCDVRVPMSKVRFLRWFILQYHSALVNLQK